MVALIAIGLSLSGCKKQATAEKYHPAKLEDTDQKGIKRVILDARAAERTGIETAVVREEPVQSAGGTEMRKVIPYGALMYDTKGKTWTFTSPQNLVYVRHAVTVERVTGDEVILTEGPPAGTTVVSVGAAELMGAEHKYGH
jgi:hypothetical protein